MVPYGGFVCNQSLLCFSFFLAYRFSYKVKSECHPDSINSPYDYYSIMHYGNKAFSVRNQVTMRAYKPGVTYFGGSQVSGLDAIRVRKMYKCKGT